MSVIDVGDIVADPFPLLSRIVSRLDCTYLYALYIGITFTYCIRHCVVLARTDYSLTSWTTEDGGGKQTDAQITDG